MQIALVELNQFINLKRKPTNEFSISKIFYNYYHCNNIIANYTTNFTFLYNG